MPDDIATDASPADADVDTDIDLEDIAPESDPDPWAEPPELDEGVDQFDRAYVESLRQEAARYRTTAKGYADTVGDVPLDEIKGAKELLDSLQTDDGVVALFTQLGVKALGLDPHKLESLFGSDEAVEEDADEDDDRIITQADLRRALADQAQQMSAQTQEQREASARSEASAALLATFAALELTDDDDKAEVMLYGDKFLPQDPNVIPTPAQVEEAVRQGKEARDKAIEKKVQQYLATKRSQKAQTPKTLGEGSGAASEEPEQPKRTLEEVIKARRAAERAARA